MFDQLPWEIKPQTLENATAEITWKNGVLRIPRYGYLEVNEMNEVAKVDPENGLYLLTHTKANELAIASELAPRYCYSLLTRLYAVNMGAKVEFTEEEDELVIKYSFLVRDFLEKINTRQNLVIIRAVTVILQRIVQGWPEEKTRRFPKELLSSLYSFYQEEERGMDKQTTPEEDERLLDEQLGKLREATLIAAGQTGSNATGSASDSGPVPLNSAENALVASQDTTSSKRSKTVTKTKENGFIAKNSAPRSSRGSKQKSTATAT